MDNVIDSLVIALARHTLYTCSDVNVMEVALAAIKGIQRTTLRPSAPVQ